MAHTPPFTFLRLAALDQHGEPVLSDGEGARWYKGTWYVVDDEIKLEA